MARVTNGEAAARRALVAERWVQGASVSGIARELRVDWQTVKRDLGVLGRELIAETDVLAQLHRLLRAAQAVESAAWEGRQLGLVLASLKTQATVLSTLQGLDLLARIEHLEQRLAELSAPPGAGFALPNGTHPPAV